MQRSLITMLATPIMIVCGLMANSSIARAESQDDVCSNRTLRGSYGFAIEGIILSIPGVTLPPGMTLPVRAIALIQFDGKGNLTVVDHFVINGQPPDTDWSPGTGTYTVNPNCTGTMAIIKPGSPPTQSKIVVVRGGKEIRSVLVRDALSSIGIKIE